MPPRDRTWAGTAVALFGATPRGGPAEIAGPTETTPWTAPATSSSRACRCRPARPRSSRTTSPMPTRRASAPSGRSSPNSSPARMPAPPRPAAAPVAYVQDRATWREMEPGADAEHRQSARRRDQRRGLLRRRDAARRALHPRRALFARWRRAARRHGRQCGDGRGRQHHRHLAPTTRASPSRATARCAARTARSANCAWCASTIRRRCAPRATACSTRPAKRRRTVDRGRPSCRARSRAATSARSSR